MSGVDTSKMVKAGEGKLEAGEGITQTQSEKDVDVRSLILPLSSQLSAWPFVAVGTWLLIGIGCYIFGRNDGIASQVKLQEAAITHTIDSLKREQKKLEHRSDSMTTIINENKTTINSKERVLIQEHNKIAQLPFTALGGDLRTRLEQAQALKWVPDTFATVPKAAR